MTLSTTRRWVDVAREERCGGGVNEADGRTFEELVRRILRRYAEQNAVAMDEAAAARVAAGLRALVEERGLPTPLAVEEMGEPGEMTPAEVASLVARVIPAGGKTEALDTPARQLVKACFQGEFRKCRDSYREVSADGTCRRQDLKRARARVSGSHCVDCPYWVELEPEPHAQFLARQWRAGAAEFAAHRGAFLPDDFRALRRCVRTMARCARP